MADQAHEATAPHLPFYITAPGETDVLFVGITVFVVVLILLLGVFYLKLHSLPEQMAHHSNHTQFQVVAILGLIALFTHNNFFWIAALILASIQLPDYEGLLTSMSESLKSMAEKLDSRETLAAETETVAAMDAPDETTKAEG
ncbi:hypothetical protein ROA7450_03159 [Roseovarius albus]|uniref:Uncharacterized protein n=1 Tax=Roseovarius albus TaxID=1247867 RepID=A0A1X6ZTD7_9RHOB|nr:hypothetical protein [Roseovarius albus]SLN61184.1 hypothetical protein ROA7450_03159 [Roseovarius albus]